MASLRFLILATVAIALPTLAAEKLPKPTRIAAGPTPAQAALIRDGIALHDQRNYDGAIAKYKQVLADNPWELTALYELTFTYFESKNYQAAIDTARLGAQCKSPVLPRFYVMMGSALDEMGKTKDAIDVYKAAIKLDSTISLLHYNLGVTLRRAGKLADAKKEFQQALQLDPAHASSHLLLGVVYQDLGYRVPAILAFSRFLALEPDSPRSEDVVKGLPDLMSTGVSRKDANNINIVLSLPSKEQKDEGDFSAVELSMSISVVAETMLEDKEGKKLLPKSPFEQLVSLYTTIGEVIANSKPKGGFAATYYAPHFNALTAAGHTEAFVTQAWMTAGLEGSDAWASANQAKLSAYRDWSAKYAWPEK